MPSIRVKCDRVPAANSTVHLCIDLTNYLLDDRNSSLTEQDPEGALKFTIAVVIVYGVGVIGLLGISARRNRTKEGMDKEANKYLKTHVGRNSDKLIRKNRKKGTSFKSISSSHQLPNVGRGYSFTRGCASGHPPSIFPASPQLYATSSIARPGVEVMDTGGRQPAMLESPTKLQAQSSQQDNGLLTEVTRVPDPEDIQGQASGESSVWPHTTDESDLNHSLLSQQDETSEGV